MTLCTPHFTEVAAHPNWTLQSVRWRSPSLHKNTGLIPEHPPKSLFSAVNSAWCSRFMFFSSSALSTLAPQGLLSIRQMSVWNINSKVYTMRIFHAYLQGHIHVHICCRLMQKHGFLKNGKCQSNVCSRGLSSEVLAWNVLLLGFYVVDSQLELTFRSLECWTSVWTHYFSYLEGALLSVIFIWSTLSHSAFSQSNKLQSSIFLSTLICMTGKNSL